MHLCCVAVLWVMRCSGIVETGIASIIDAMSLSEVISLTNEWSIMQSACINYCARMAQDCVVSIGRCIGMGTFWGESRVERMEWRVIFAFAFSRIIPADLDTSFNRYIVTYRYIDDTWHIFISWYVDAFPTLLVISSYLDSLICCLFLRQHSCIHSMAHFMLCAIFSE